MACEGTRFTEKKRLESMKYGKEKNLPELKYHILPRARGFTLILHGAKGKSKLNLIEFYSISRFLLVPGIYNFMLAFTKDSASPKFRTLLDGRSCKAQLYVK
jgi:lysophosphatidic acid acyltransferase/lysophosphatidylinositol acyltransferase